LFVSLDRLSLCFDAAAVDETELDINHILGRKVKNLSKNKYKFVSNSAAAQRLKSNRRTPLPRKSQCVSTSALKPAFLSVA